MRRKKTGKHDASLVLCLHPAMFDSRLFMLYRPQKRQNACSSINKPCYWAFLWYFEYLKHFTEECLVFCMADESPRRRLKDKTGFFRKWKVFQVRHLVREERTVRNVFSVLSAVSQMFQSLLCAPLVWSHYPDYKGGADCTAIEHHQSQKSTQ